MPPVGSVRRTIKLAIDTTEYNVAITSAKVTPNVETQQIRTLAPDGVATDASEPTWALDVEYNVEYAPDGFYRFLVGSYGQQATFVYEPEPVREPGITVTGTLLVVPGDSGGAVGDVDSGSVSLPIIGVPVWADPLPAP